MQETDNGWSDEDIHEMADVNETTRLMSSDHCGQSHTMSFKSAVTAEADSERFAINKGYISGQDEASSEKDAIPSLPETNSDDDRGRATKQQQTTAYVWLLSFFAAIGGFLFGYDTGVVSGAMLLLREEFSLSPVLQEVIVSVTIGAAFLSAIIGGYLSDAFGRKVCTILASLVFTAGALVLALAENVTMLIIGRLIIGIGIGKKTACNTQFCRWKVHVL